jgi:CheY-like chemotaxis protein
MHTHVATTGEEAGAASSTVLVVEDDTLLRLTTAEMLRESGFQVIEAGSSTEAVNVLRSGPHVDLLFSDVQLPDRMDGVELSNFTREYAPDTKVILTTGGPEPKQLAGDLENAVPMLRKPYRMNELVRRIHQLLGDPEV